MEITKFDGPIPGENYTSDTKNYPWHRPPEITDYDEALEFSVKALTDPEVGFNFISILEAGYSLATAADIFVTQGIGDGKWTPDFAILLAGPVARTLQIMARSYGIEPEVGIDKAYTVISPGILAAYSGQLSDPEAGLEAVDETAEQAEEIVSEAVEGISASGGTRGGLMGSPSAAAPEDEQMAMLGYGDEEAAPMPEENVEIK